MKKLLSLAASLVALQTTHALPNPVKGVEDFERAYHDSLDYHFGHSLRLIGYKSIKVEESERPEFEAHIYDDLPGRNESNDPHNNAYFDAPSSTLRIYFPVEGALLNHDGGIIEANELGELTVDKVLGDYAVLGRKQTDDVTGVKGNVIKDGVIYLSPPVLPQRQYDSKIYVYDFGIKSIFHHHQHHNPRRHVHHTKRAWWNPFDWVGGADEGDEQGEDEGEVGCYKNHGGKTCTVKFGIRHGRCPYDTTTCMDYNGWWTDCENKKSNFLGSDCYTAMSKGHCWNEVM
jgi:hypothetical protein